MGTYSRRIEELDALMRPADNHTDEDQVVETSLRRDGARPEVRGHHGQAGLCGRATGVSPATPPRLSMQSAVDGKRRQEEEAAAAEAAAKKRPYWAEDSPAAPSNPSPARRIPRPAPSTKPRTTTPRRARRQEAAYDPSKVDAVAAIRRVLRETQAADASVLAGVLSMFCDDLGSDVAGDEIRAFLRFESQRHNKLQEPACGWPAVRAAVADRHGSSRAAFTNMCGGRRGGVMSSQELLRGMDELGLRDVVPLIIDALAPDEETPAADVFVEFDEWMWIMRGGSAAAARPAAAARFEERRFLQLEKDVPALTADRDALRAQLEREMATSRCLEEELQQSRAAAAKDARRAAALEERLHAIEGEHARQAGLHGARARLSPPASSVDLQEVTVTPGHLCVDVGSWSATGDGAPSSPSGDMEVALHPAPTSPTLASLAPCREGTRDGNTSSLVNNDLEARDARASRSPYSSLREGRARAPKSPTSVWPSHIESNRPPSPSKQAAAPQLATFAALETHAHPAEECVVVNRTMGEPLGMNLDQSLKVTSLTQTSPLPHYVVGKRLFSVEGRRVETPEDVRQAFAAARAVGPLTLRFEEVAAPAPTFVDSLGRTPEPRPVPWAASFNRQSESRSPRERSVSPPRPFTDEMGQTRVDPPSSSRRGGAPSAYLLKANGAANGPTGAPAGQPTPSPITGENVGVGGLYDKLAQPPPSHGRDRPVNAPAHIPTVKTPTSPSIKTAVWPGVSAGSKPANTIASVVAGSAAPTVVHAEEDSKVKNTEAKGESSQACTQGSSPEASQASSKSETSQAKLKARPATVPPKSYTPGPHSPHSPSANSCVSDGSFRTADSPTYGLKSMVVPGFNSGRVAKKAEVKPEAEKKLEFSPAEDALGDGASRPETPAQLSTDAPSDPAQPSCFTVTRHLDEALGLDLSDNLSLKGIIAGGPAARDIPDTVVGQRLISVNGTRVHSVDEVRAQISDHRAIALQFSED